ncbi:TPA: hypothetical protein JG804_003989 [Vibrio parahaemolyticus]|uniref:hypothetical protein n=2 Tax=Vibrio parahaemolyticus TaxID=670 RepID=UPI0020503137|nr:hypothetical protein [Vibrio parahaemolyticus]UPR06138.1 hypothetical protein H9K48_12400 [Vibrio parahaemolyticus]HAV1378881.1 hypothetical protein [Vibrio parahaemolyticus]HAV1409815.1 hypothetical protein [Vibrio parahaemolyticus]HAV1466409.1 hypothetical protein [Vibrio parahaemolyticus]HAV1530322.1 hypothetical protein [Vibrio parahaemolyticus]
MYTPLKNNDDTIVTIIVTDNANQDAIDSIIKNTNHKLVSTSSECLSSTVATMKSAKLKVALVAFDFSMINVHSVVETCMYNKVEIKDVNSSRIIKRKEVGILSDVYLLADFYNEFSTDKNLGILVNAVRSLVPVHASVDEAISMLSSIADVPVQVAEQKLHASISTIRNVVNSTTNLNYSTKLSSKEEMYMKVFNRANESVDTIELIKAQTGAEKTTQAQRLCRLAYNKRIKSCSITTLRSVAEQYAPKKAKTVVAHSEKSISAFEQADHFSCTMHSLLKDHVFEFVKNCGYFIFDECEKNIQALFEESSGDEVEFLNQKQKEIIRSRLAELFSKNGSRVVAMDADASDAISLRFLRSLGKKVNAYDLNYSEPTHPLHVKVSKGAESALQLVELARPFVNSASTCQQDPYSSITAQIDDIDMMKTRLVDKKLIDDNENMFIASDHKREAINILKGAGYVKASGLVDEEAALKAKILLVHADNKGQPEQKAFLKNPNTEIVKYKTVIVTPCVREGFNITANYSNTVIVLCHSILLPMSLVQMSRRLRTANNIIFALDTDRKPSLGFSNYLEGAATLEERLEAEFAKRRDVLLSDLALSLTLTLENLGFNHQAPTRYSEDEKALVKKEQNSVKKANKKFLQEAIASAECIDSEAAKRLEQSTCKSEETTMSVEKKKVADKLAIDVKDVDIKAVKFAEKFKKDHAVKVAEIIADKVTVKVKRDAKQTIKQKNITEAMQIFVDALRGNITDAEGNEIELDLTTEFVIADVVEVYSYLHANKAKFNKAFSQNDKMRITESKVKANDKATAEKRLRALLKALGIDSPRFGSTNNKRYKHCLHPLAAPSLKALGLLEKEQSSEFKSLEQYEDVLVDLYK